MGILQKIFLEVILEIYTKKLKEDSSTEPHYTCYWLLESKLSEETQECTHPRSADEQLTSEEENQITKESPREPDTPATIAPENTHTAESKSQETPQLSCSVIWQIITNNYF